MEYLRPIKTAPKDGTYILIFGSSGYLNTPLRCEVARWEYLNEDSLLPEGFWANHAGDWFTDGGPEPLYWCPIPSSTFKIEEA
jgi:hypothetical protein